MKPVLPVLLAALACTAVPAGEGPFRHPDDAYPQLGLSWRPIPGAGPCERIWTHPLLGASLALGGEKGLRISHDTTATWITPSGLPTGAVTSLAWHPGNPQEAIVVAAGGLWRSSDGCRSFARLPAKDLPPAAGVWYLPREPRSRTLLVAHGEQATGLSVSSDGGATWRQVLTEYHVHQVFTGALGSQGLALIASLSEEPQVRSLLCLPSLNEKPVEAQRDCAITDGALPVHSGPQHFSSTRDGLVRLEARDNGFQELQQVATGQDSGNGASSLGLCWGAHVDRQLLFAFDPYGNGASYTSDGKSWITVSSGLPLGDMTKEGSVFRPNANGSRFYAIINDRAYMGTPADLRLDGLSTTADPPVAIVLTARYATAISELSTGLATFAAASDPIAAARALGPALDELDAAVQPAAVRLSTRLAKDEAPKRVTVDLSRFGQSSAEAMHDDGKHGDGAAGDGVYATEVVVRPNRLTQDNKDWRRSPGILGLSVSAHWADGARSGAVAPLLVWGMVESQDLFIERKAEEQLAKVVAADGMTRTASIGPRGPEVSFTANGGAWKTSIRLDYYWRSCMDVSPYSGLSLEWRGGPAALHLLDKPLYDDPRASATVAIAPTGDADADGWTRVRIPFSDLITDDATFDRNRVVALVITGEAKAEQTYSIRLPRLLSSDDWNAP